MLAPSYHPLHAWLAWLRRLFRERLAIDSCMAAYVVAVAAAVAPAAALVDCEQRRVPSDDLLADARAPP